jgi:hypothetical protein
MNLGEGPILYLDDMSKSLQSTSLHRIQVWNVCFACETASPCRCLRRLSILPTGGVMYTVDSNPLSGLRDPS